MTRPAPYSTIRQVAVHVPADRQTGADIEDDVRARNPGVRLLPGLLRQMYGFEERCVAPAGAWPSDLAAAAGRRALDRAGLTADAVDLLIFGSAGEDWEEPATAHVVADKLGVTAPVFDVQNACNGFLNALEIADGLIRAGNYRRVLVTTGELNSRLARTPFQEHTEFARFLPVLTLGDLGAAVVVEAAERPGILGSTFRANSTGWPTGTISNPYHDPHFGRVAVRFDAHGMADAFVGMEEAAFEALRDRGLKIDDIDLFCVHHASVRFAEMTCEALSIPVDKTSITFPRYGNVATATLPLQLAEAAENGRLRRGDLVALFGLASGASAGMILLEWRPTADT